MLSNTPDLDILTILCGDDHLTLHMRKLRPRRTHVLEPRPGPEPGVVAGLVLRDQAVNLGLES